MKSITKMTAALLVSTALMAAVLAMAACNTGPKAKGEAVDPETVQKTEVLDDKGAAFNAPTPAWLAAYLGLDGSGGGNHAIEALPQYQNEHCFVVEYNNPSRDFALEWINRLNGQAQVAQMISTTVHTDAQGSLSGRSDSATVAAEMSAVMKAYSDASYTGLNREGDWWQIVRNKSTNVQECRAFALFTADRELLDEQIAGNLQNIIDQNTALSEAARAIYLDVIMRIRSNGFANSSTMNIFTQ